MNTTPSASDPLAGASFLTAEAPREAAVRFWTDLNLHQPPGEIASAVLTATAHGVYEARIDGMPASDSVLDPGWTSYEWRLPYQRFDVTDLLRAGSSTSRIELLLGNGWYRGDLGFAGADANYGDEIAIAAAIEVTYRDGSVQHLATSPEWHAETSEIIRNSLYNGETIDARLRGRAESLPLREIEIDRSSLVPQAGPPVRRQEVLHPVRIWASPSGRLLLDFGQNLVGWLRFGVQAPAGTRSRSATPRCSRTASWRPGSCATRRRRMC